MSSFLALLAFLQAASVEVSHVRIPVADGTLDAALVRPVKDGTGHATDIGQGIAVIALHGCGGPSASRDGSWAIALAREGFTVLLPDSFGSRGLGSQCRVRNREVRPSGKRREDAIAAAEWLQRQPPLTAPAVGARASPRGGASTETAPPFATPGENMPKLPASAGTAQAGMALEGATQAGLAPRGIALMGWSNGGGTVLATARAPDLPPGLFQRFVAFYPGCTTAKTRGWKPAAPLMVLVGAADDWTPAAPCRAFAARYPDLITLAEYPDAYHDFDAPDQPVRVLRGLATPPSGTGRAHTGTNPAARQDALKRVPAFLAGL